MKKDLVRSDLGVFYDDQSYGGEEWLTSSEAAEFLKLTKAALMNWTSNGTVPFYKFGGRNRYLKSELDQLLRKEPRGVRDGDSL